MKQHSGEEILQLFTEVAPYLNDIVIEDIGISVIKEGYYTAYVPGQSFDLGVRAGEPMKGQVSEKCMKSGEKVIATITKEQSAFGIPYIACAHPIKEGEDTIGCIITTQAITKQEKIRTISYDLATSTEEFTASMEEIAAGSQELAGICRELGQLSGDLVNTIKQTDEIVAFIRNVANQTNLLGLNAAIESARVGEVGRGFGVVAQEVRKLAVESADSVKNIKTLLDKIQDSISLVNEKIGVIDKTVETQEQSIQAMAQTSQGFATMANELANISENGTIDNKTE